MRALIPLRAIFARTTWGDRTLFAACQAGLVNNLNDGMSWGILPIFFAAQGLHVEGIGVLKFVYPTVWSLSQIITGPLADIIGRKPLIATGMAVQAAGIWLILATHTFGWWLSASILLGVGTAMVLNGSVINLGTAAGAAVGGLLLAVGGYHAIGLGLPVFALLATVLMSIDRQCSSGMMAIATAAKEIIDDGMQIAVGGGVESVSFVQGDKMVRTRGDDPELMARMPSLYMTMIETAEIVAKKYGITGRDGGAAEAPAEALRGAVVESAVADRRD